MSHRVAERHVSPRAAPRPQPALPTGGRRAGALTVGADDSAAERQARQVARRVVAGGAAAAVAARPDLSPVAPDTTPDTQPGASMPNPPVPVAAGAAATLHGAGAALDAGVRRDMEQRFGHDFSAVRIHADVGAARSARALHADAYTDGASIVFGAGRFAPAHPAGRLLLAHELTHVLQNRGNAAMAATLRRQPAPGAPTAAPPAAPGGASAAATKADDVAWDWVWKDATVWPLLKAIVDDLRQINMKPGDRAPLTLKGTEGAALYPWTMGLGMGPSGFAGGDKAKDAGDALSATYKYAEALKGLTPAGDIVLDPLSRLFGMRVDDYLGSDLFMTRLKAHSAAVATLALAGQGINSLIAAVKPKNDDPTALEGDAATQHTVLVRAMVGAVLKKQLTAPDFFGMGPLQMATHPAYSVSPFAGGGPPSGLTFERKVDTAGTQRELKTGLTLNLPSLLKPGDASATDIADPAKYRGWQGSAWFSYESSAPLLVTPDKQAGSKWKAGVIGGGGGHLAELEAGMQYAGPAGALTSWFARGGYGYAAGDKETGLKKIGFTATYINWTEHDVLAPPDASGVPAAGAALKLTPLAAAQFKPGDKHIIDANLALSFVTGTAGGVGASGMGDLTGGLAYTYLGNTAPGALPAFKLELAGSVNRLDWWNPDSPLMWGAKVKGNVGRYFGGASVMTGAAGIDRPRLERIGPTVRTMVPTAVLLTGGVAF
ncbi:MAG: DUF4157 domain-containing protein [Pseudomonadota bacterium]